MTSALISTHKVSYQHHDRIILDQVNFALYANERVSLEGDIGAGKTTFLHLLVGLNKATSGQINAFGQDRSNEDDFFEVRAKAGLLFQDADDQLFCPTVLEDVAFGPLNLGESLDQAKQTAITTLEYLGLSGYEDRVSQRLSSGEKRLVTLATILAMKPQVLLLDEPSTALDSTARNRLIDVLLELEQAMIIISHDSEFLKPLTSRRTRLHNHKIQAI